MSWNDAFAVTNTTTTTTTEEMKMENQNEMTAAELLTLIANLEAHLVEENLKHQDLTMASEAAEEEIENMSFEDDLTETEKYEHLRIWLRRNDESMSIGDHFTIYVSELLEDENYREQIEESIFNEIQSNSEEWKEESRYAKERQEVIDGNADLISEFEHQCEAIENMLSDYRELVKPKLWAQIRAITCDINDSVYKQDLNTLMNNLAAMNEIVTAMDKGAQNV